MARKMDPLDALWRRDYADFALRELQKQMQREAPKNGLDRMVDEATGAGAARTKEYRTAIEHWLREIIACQQVLGGDTARHKETLDQVLSLK